MSKNKAYPMFFLLIFFTIKGFSDYLAPNYNIIKLPDYNIDKLPDYNSDKLQNKNTLTLTENEALKCLKSRKNPTYDEDCVGKSLKLIAFVKKYSSFDDGYTFNTSKYANDYTNFALETNIGSLKKNRKVRITGVFQEKDWLSSSPKIKGLVIWRIPLTEREKEFADYEKNRESNRKKSIAAAYKTRDNFDAIVRDNVSTRRKALEAAAVNISTHNTSGSVMSVGYTMKDGRLIICTTKVLPSAPAVMECDGKP